MELWLHGFAVPGRVAELARRAQAWGFHGLLLADSQNLTADIWIELALAAAATSTLRLGPGVTNPQTRHPAVTASAAATLQRESGGRVSLGLARGDSALSQIGLRPLRPTAFEAELVRLQRLLAGETADFPGAPDSRIAWLDGDAKVPVHVAATGPETVAAAARHADGVDLTVGAEPERIAAGVAVARSAAPGPLQLGAYLNVAVDDDPTRARALIRGSVATFARFSVGATGLSPQTRAGVATAAGSYETARHGQARAGSAQELGDEFIDRFAIAGAPETVIRRLTEIAGRGIERVVVVPGSLDSDPEAVARSCERIASDVRPALSGL